MKYAHNSNNTGPLIHGVDPTKTIQAPYSKGAVVVFGQSAGQKCVAMSLCPLIYHTELPTTLTVAKENYPLEYSASYSGNVHGEATIEGYEYCLGLKRAFESLISQ